MSFLDTDTPNLSPKKVVWVIGSGGMLGGALCNMLFDHETELFFSAVQIPWNRSSELASQLAINVAEFSSRASRATRWEIYWAAGVGTMGSTEASLSTETRALALMLSFLAADARLMRVPGAIAFASSAGAIYAGSNDLVITENSLPAPTTAYAREKLRQEEMVRSFTGLNTGITALIARISTIYGARQASAKQQGLLSHIARNIVQNRPIQIFVPYDTIRDYIHVDDAAGTMVQALRAAIQASGIWIKIIASERPATIAEIISIFKRTARRSPRIITSASLNSTNYSRRIQFRSLVLPVPARAQQKSLLIGIAHILMEERSAFARRSSESETPRSALRLSSPV